MAIVFVMTFNYLGAWLSDGMTMVVNWVIALIGRDWSQRVSAQYCSHWLWMEF